MNASKMQTSKLLFHRRNSLIFRGGGGFVYKQKSRPKGEESALVTGNPAVPVAASSDLPIVGGIAVSTFGFPSPFQAPTNNERPSAMFAGMDSRTTTPAAPLLAPPPGTTLAQPSSVPASNQKFLSQMSALDLAQVVADENYTVSILSRGSQRTFFQH